MSAASKQIGAKDPSPSSTLSAEAAEFVPGRLAASDLDGLPQRAKGGGKSLVEVPRYLTTCYPFVSLSDSQGVKVGVDGTNAVSGGNRPYGPGYAAGNLQQACPPLGSFPTQMAYPSSPHPWLPGLQPPPTFTPALPMATLTPGVHIPFDGGTPAAMGGGGGLLPNGKGDGLLPTPPYPPMNAPGVLSPAMNMMMPYSSAQLYMSADRKVFAAAAAAANRGRQNQAGRGGGSNVSRGTQKETFSMPSGGRAHTIMMKDNSVQTDFSKDIADLTLQEKPNMLYRRGQRKNKGSQPILSTDSEEVDSDSGYSSPLHRRNLVSNGTHPVRISAMQNDAEHGKSAGDRGKGVGQYSKPFLPQAATTRDGQQIEELSRQEGAIPTISSRNLKVPARGVSQCVWGSEVMGSGSGLGQRETTMTPGSSTVVWGKESARGKGTMKGRSSTPTGGKEASRSEERNSSRGAVVVPGEGQQQQQRSQAGSSNTGTKTPPNTGSTINSRQPHSPGSPRREAPSPAPLDFPILKPAKRNEPPWSLTPSMPRGKKGESSGFMGMMADTVRSYASIVKSLSSPAGAQSPDSVTQQQQQAPPPSLQGKSEGCAGSVVAGKNSIPSKETAKSPLQGTGGSGDPWAHHHPQAGDGRKTDALARHSDHIQLGRGAGGSQAVSAGGGSPASTTSSAWSMGSGAVVAGGCKKTGGPVWVGKEKGTVLRGSAGDLRHDALSKQQRGAGSTVGPGLPLPSGTHQHQQQQKQQQQLQAWGGAGGTTLHQDSGALRAEPKDLNSKQCCDKRINNSLGGGEGGGRTTPPSFPTTDKAPPSQNATLLSHDFPPLDSSSRDGAGSKEGGNKTDSTHRQSAASGDEKTEDEGKKKRKRKRRRRRRGKSASGDREGGGGGLSDGLSGMERTVSSSNISRTSDVTLHFEDESEFPEIGAVSGSESGMYSSMGGSNNAAAAGAAGAAAGVSPAEIAGHGALSDVGVVIGNTGRTAESMAWMSYSDIVKRKPTVNDVRSRTQSAPGSCLSGEEGGDENFNSQPGQGSSGQTSVSKRTRKRQKRRDLANRAAEAELAEISLEQQMLRELGHKGSGRGSRPGSGSRDERSKSREEKSPARGLITDQSVVKQAKGGGGGESSGNRLHQPIALNIADMLDAFEKKKSLEQKVSSAVVGSAVGTKKVGGLARDEKKVRSANILDSSAPVKRGKEREMPKPKKPSPLKKVILKEREEKKRMRLIDECDVYTGVGLPGNTDPETDPETNNAEEDMLEEDTAGNPVGLGESDLSQDGLSSRSVDTDQGVSPGADLSPISQTSPLSMSPLTPGASPLNSPIAGYLGRDPVVLRIHSRRFREYCTQILDKDIDACCTALLHELVRFQDRMYHKDPNKAKGKRRVVLGLREVTKHLKLKKIKCVIISPNLEKIQSKGGLDEALNNILTMCQDQNVPFVFALGRRALGRACAKLVPVSVAGIFNYEGCEEKFNQLISLTHKGREAYADMVHAVEREIAENPPPSMSVGSSVPSLYAHMGHSRTPSGCSAISFTSSVLSEPISENYPHAEPETDSKGYEIVRDPDGKVVPVTRMGGAFVKGNGGALGGYQPAVDDFDDGNEADTEDINDCPPRWKGAGKKEGARGRSEATVVGADDNGQGSQSPAMADGAEDSSRPSHAETKDAAPWTEKGPAAGSEGTDQEDRQASDDDGESESESDSQRCSSSLRNHLPPFDSIHSSSYDLSAEILSQHSSRTVDNSEVLSTHSSRTLGDGSLTPNTEHGKDRPHTPDTPSRLARGSSASSGGAGGSVGGGVRLMNKDRVQSWVESCLQEEEREGDSTGVEEEEDDDNDSAASCNDEDSEGGPVCGNDT